MKFTIEQKRNLEMALIHLEENGPESSRETWYFGSLTKFESRQSKAIAMLREWVAEGACVTRKNEHRIDHAGE